MPRKNLHYHFHRCIVPKIRIQDFHLEHTLLCGQLFRVTRQDDWYHIIVRDRILKIRQRFDCLEFHGVSKEFLLHYFALDEPYIAILTQINKDPYIDNAIKKYHGLRIIRQDPWECVISFLCSSAANIPKITLNLELLSSLFGKRIRLNKFEGYAFPNPGDLNSYQGILMAKTGFRAGYIKTANELVTEEFLQSLRKLSYSEAKKALKNIPGIGDKIADCILLFSLGFSEAFPIDIWIRRVLQEVYFKNRLISDKHLRDFGTNYFGKYAGYAQQFLYMFVRNSILKSDRRTQEGLGKVISKDRTLF
ncbi:MAG: DNA-3-methyladenine glycosylase 2 family protein [wastewater metagenome]|nr:DNA-3-methyladenine glycosylase 2 family protein [Candidatus Loosdrechtia aerotolerans]